MADLKCDFDRNKGEAAILDGQGNVLMQGTGIEDVTNQTGILGGIDSALNRAMGIRAGQDFSGSAVLPKSNGEAIGDFRVTTTSRDSVSCSAPGYNKVPGPKR